MKKIGWDKDAITNMFLSLPHLLFCSFLFFSHSVRKNRRNSGVNMFGQGSLDLPEATFSVDCRMSQP